MASIIGFVMRCLCLSVPQFRLYYAGYSLSYWIFKRIGWETRPGHKHTVAAWRRCTVKHGAASDQKSSKTPCVFASSLLHAPASVESVANKQTNFPQEDIGISLIEPISEAGRLCRPTNKQPDVDPRFQSFCSLKHRAFKLSCTGAFTLIAPRDKDVVLCIQCSLHQRWQTLIMCVCVCLASWRCKTKIPRS